MALPILTRPRSSFIADGSRSKKISGLSIAQTLTGLLISFIFNDLTLRILISHSKSHLPELIASVKYFFYLINF